jgi:hypothetical protein
VTIVITAKIENWRGHSNIVAPPASVYSLKFTSMVAITVTGLPSFRPGLNFRL